MTDTDIEVLRNNPLHGLKLETLLNELVEHYGWEVLAQAVNINCFKTNPSIISSVRFLKKTIWAREKLEGFYLYKFKRLPKPDDVNYELPPRDRIIPLEQQPRSPAVITINDEIRQEDEDASRRRDNPRGKWTPTKDASPRSDRAAKRDDSPRREAAKRETSASPSADKREEMIKRVWGKS